jgi:hypothetical protein
VPWRRKARRSSPNRLKPYLEALHPDTERRPFAEQIIDQLLVEDEARYKVYEDIRAKQSDFGVDTRGALEPELHDAMGFFLRQWINFERAVSEIANRATGPTGERLPWGPSSRLLDKLGLLDDDGRREVEWIRRVRNNLVHGVEIPAPSDLREAGARLQALVARLGNKH